MRLRLRIFKTSEERSRGLMNIASMDENEGGLFVFGREDLLQFWGKNTLINLDIAFINEDGIIVDIKRIKSNDLNPVISSEPAQYALEMNDGWFNRHGYTVGMALPIGAMLYA